MQSGGHYSTKMKQMEPTKEEHDKYLNGAESAASVILEGAEATGKISVGLGKRTSCAIR